jgi:hypothetical protein
MGNKRLHSIRILALIAWGMPALAQVQSRPVQLAVTGLLSPSISLIFENSPGVGSTGYCPLTNSGTNAVGLILGEASYNTGDTLSCAGFSRLGNNYIVSSAFDVLVTETNSTSTSYHLAAALSAAPPANVSWAINGTTLSTAFTTFQGANSYGQAVTETLAVTVRRQVAAQTLSTTITFMATAN